MNSRIKQARKSLKLSQEEFASRLGITGSGVSNLESGRRGITPQMIMAICREFGISESWLRTGKGEMFTYADETSIERLAQQMGLDEFAIRALVAYQKLTPQNRAAIKRYILSIAVSCGASIPHELAIELELDSYKQELQAEKFTQTASALPKQKDA